jgi:hypothetical protein
MSGRKMQTAIPIVSITVKTISFTYVTAVTSRLPRRSVTRLAEKCRERNKKRTYESVDEIYQTSWI